jgi:hypothetical protein
LENPLESNEEGQRGTVLKEANGISFGHMKQNELS